MKLLQVSSLRKSAALVQEAAEALRAGRSLAFPTECGMMQAHFPPRTPALHLAAEAPPFVDERLALAASTFWPGPLWLRTGPPGAKRTWFVPSHPLALALLRQVGEPVGATEGEDADLGLVWKEPPPGLTASEVDATGQPWRWLRSGVIERREWEWLTGTPTVLSGAALGAPIRSGECSASAGAEDSVMPFWRVER